MKGLEEAYAYLNDYCDMLEDENDKLLSELQYFQNCNIAEFTYWKVHNKKMKDWTTNYREAKRRGL